MEYLLYLSAVITTLSVAGLLYYKNKYNTLLSSVGEKVMDKFLDESKKEISNKRMCRIVWGSWHKKANPSVKWDVSLELREVAVSTDEKKIKFEVVSAVSSGTDDKWSLAEYSDYFNRKFNGGWLELDSAGIPEFKNSSGASYGSQIKFDWITTISKSEARQNKIDKILEC